jgi:hypothetical protein
MSREEAWCKFTYWVVLMWHVLIGCGCGLSTCQEHELDADEPCLRDSPTCMSRQTRCAMC